MSAQDVIAGLRARFAAPEYAFLTEVGDSTGYRSRSADGLAVSLWPSRGLTITGFEVKVSRADWLSELRNPEKAETICRFCDFWYLAVPDLRIVAAGELPPSWGLIVVGAARAAVQKEAPKLEPKELGRPFLAAVCRAASKAAVSENELKVAFLRGKVEAQKQEEKNAEQRFASLLESERRRAEDLRLKISEFELQSGVSMLGWRGTHIGRAVAALERHRDHNLRTSLVDQRSALANLLKDYDAVIEATAPAAPFSEGGAAC